MLKKSLLLVCLLFIIANDATRTRRKKIGADKLQNVFSWKQIEFENGGLAGQNEKVFDVPMGFDVWEDRVFLGFPRRREGVPSSLNYVSLSDNSKSPVVKPYPDEENNNLNGTSPIVSVSRPRVDACGRLWVMDTGVVSIKGVPNQVKPPKIVIIDLKTDTVIKRYELKNGRDYMHNDASGMVSTTVDIPEGDCDNAFAYIPDLFQNAIVVYSLKADDSWRVQHNFMHMSPEEGEFSLNGLQFQWDDGVFSIALGRERPDGYRTVYFHAMSSYSERAVSSEVLRNKTLATRRFHGDDFKTVGVRGPKSQTNIHAVDQESGVMFSIQPHTSSMHCWNTRTALAPRNIGAVAQDYELLFYPSDLKLDAEGNVWVLSNKFPVFLYSTLDRKQDNIRLFRVPINEAIRNTICY